MGIFPTRSSLSSCPRIATAWASFFWINGSLSQVRPGSAIPSGPAGVQFLGAGGYSAALPAAGNEAAEDLTEETYGSKLNDRTGEDQLGRHLKEKVMSTDRGGKKPLWTCLTVLAVFAVAFWAATPAAHAAGGKKKHNPNAQKVTVDKVDAMVVQLAQDVYAKALGSHKESALARTEFHKAKDLLKEEMVLWAKNGKLLQVRQSGWKPAGLTAQTGGTGLVDIPKIEKSLKVSPPDFTEYTRYWVHEAEKQWSPTSAAKAAPHKPAHPNAARKQAVARKPVTKTVVKKVVQKPVVVKNTKTAKASQ
jgi:hypothetical protein